MEPSEYGCQSNTGWGQVSVVPDQVGLDSGGDGRADTWWESSLGRLSGAGLGGPSAGTSMDIETGAALGFVLPPREGEGRAGHRFQALRELGVADAIG